MRVGRQQRCTLVKLGSGADFMRTHCLAYLQCHAARHKAQQIGHPESRVRGSGIPRRNADVWNPLARTSGRMVDGPGVEGEDVPRQHRFPGDPQDTLRLRGSSRHRLSVCRISLVLHWESMDIFLFNVCRLCRSTGNDAARQLDACVESLHHHGLRPRRSW